jgi:uncharacterized OB-fold protein
VPYTIALVDLDEGFRMLAGLLHTEASTIRIGQRLEVRFVEEDHKTTLPWFRPHGDA